MAHDERPVDAQYMRRALDLARRGWGQTAPNPMVGAVVVRDGSVVGEGWHARFGEPHAEVMALRAAGDRARGATLYVTLEPCNHFGKTPPCTEAIIASGISHVAVAVRDPNPTAAGGVERLRAAGMTVEIGIAEDDARELNAAFFHGFASDRPWVIVKLAVSLDGAIADAERTRGWLTGPESRREVHRMRAGVDAVGVGVGTLLVDDPRLTVRECGAPRVAPRRVIFDSTLRTPPGAAVVLGAREVPTTIIATEPDPMRARALRDAGVEILVARDLGDALRALAASGVRSLLVEGGARLAGSLLAAEAVDRLVIFQAPIILGAGALNAFAHTPPAVVERAHRLHVIEQRRFGNDTMTIYAFGTR